MKLDRDPRTRPRLLGRRPRGWWLALLLGLALSLLLGPPATALINLPGPPANTAEAGWPDANRAYPCGRLWCSAVVFPHDILSRRLIVLAIQPTGEMTNRDAAQAAEARARTVQRSVDGLIQQMRQSLRDSAANLSAERKLQAAAMRESADMDFWNPLYRQPRHPLTPTVAVGFRNNVPVVFVPASQDLGVGPVTLLSVTEPDAATAGTTTLELAERWRSVLEGVISESLWGLEFNRRYPVGRLLLAVMVSAFAVLLLLGLSAIRRSLRRALRQMRRNDEALRDSAKREVMATYTGNLETRAEGEGAGEHAAGAGSAAAAPTEGAPGEPTAGPEAPQPGWIERLLRRAERQPQLLMQGTSRLIGTISIPSLQQQGLRKQTRNLLEMALLISNLVQLSLVVAGVAAIAAFFPGSRIASILMLRQSLLVPLLWLGVIVARWLLVLTIDHSINSWTIESTIRDPNSRRYALRADTYAKVFNSMATIVCIGLGIALTLVIVGIDQSVLTGAGVVAVAAGLLLRNILEDFMQGLLIILTDRYAIGDVVTIPPHSGFVENMNLFNTQLRGIDGQLTSLPNGQIRAVENLTKDWSRVNFTIEVAAGENLRRVLAVIGQVAEEMHRDPEWSQYVLGTPEVLGVDEVRQSGCLIRVWIQTLPLAQWPVGREFRVRVKEAFDREGIRLGLPRQEVVLNEALSPATSP
jgi:small conductance mechanosensitive channel